ncbi:MAG: type II toxin-antitoxin system HicB family antitoxin [Thiotrichales bacterium]|nr:type II toxin-antitoxin system HicB family antitoxin [Thiotrichales bacterium]MCY4350502.1 type II toxin-antitoxin system HicB family antitoxin [Thiotrichales bacterium]
MTRRLTAIIEREGYVALCPEIDAASQGSSAAEARGNLVEALALFFDAAPSEETDRRLGGELHVTRIEERLPRR